MKNYLTLLLLPAIALLLQGCKTRHCPGYPQEDTNYLPVGFVGQTLRYVFDSDTIVFNVMPPDFTEKYDDRPQHGINDDCMSHAWLDLMSPDEKSWLLYRMMYYKGKHTLCLDFQYENKTFSGMHYYCVDGIYDEVGDLEQLVIETLPQWTSPNKQTYIDIMKFIYSSDTLYLSKQYGLLFWDVPDKHSLTLLP